MATLTQIKQSFSEKLHHAADLATRSFTYQGQEGFIIYLNTLVDEQWLERTFFEPLFNDQEPGGTLQTKLAAVSIETLPSIEAAVLQLWKGRYVIVYNEASVQIIAVKTPINLNRSIEEPSNDRALRGAHDGFVESLSTNLSLVRRHGMIEHLTVKKQDVGASLKKEIALVYVEGLADPAIVEQVTKKLGKIDQDLISSPGTLNELLQDSKRSFFPQILYTERPDAVVGNIAEGRIALLIEGNPTALILPVSFFSFLQAVDDYNVHFVLGSFFRIIRTTALLISILLPSLYISLVAFHFEIIPQPLIISVKSSLQYIPYPPLIEALIMEFTIELIREAGLRLPAPIGQTIGIVGGLVIGEAVVNAGLVSNIMIIVVAVTAISTFVIPSPEMSSVIRITRFPLMLAAATFGLIGVVLSFFAVLMHLIKLESFGTPYLTPLAPFKHEGLKDTLLRFPIWLIQRHTSMTSSKRSNDH